MITYGLLSSLILILACTGFGGSLLKPLGAKTLTRNNLEWCVWCFTAGQGILGWILFFPGVFGGFSYQVFIIILSFGLLLCFIIFFPTSKYNLVFHIKSPNISIKTAIITLAILIIITIDAFEATAPPADADSLAYHFALPKQFLNDNAIVFFPKAVDAAIPLLVHLTYATALEIGGELGLSFWATLTGWNTSLLVYLIAGRFLLKQNKPLL